MKQEYLYTLFSVVALCITFIVFFLATLMYGSNDVYASISSSQKNALSLTALQEEESQKLLLLDEEIERSNSFYEGTQNELQSVLLDYDKTDQAILSLEEDLSLIKQKNRDLKKELSNLEARLP